jgi:hydroxysqualene synthase
MSIVAAARGQSVQWSESGPVSVEHYENFPVASVLCPPQLRPPITAIYHFARTADDIADEGTASAVQRRADLQAFRADLTAVAAGRAPSSRWAGVFVPLAAAVATYRLPLPLLHDLLDAFEQDAGNPTYPDRSTLLDYCRRSANPVGRLLLHLYGIDDEDSLRQSDAVCSALQLINFWQDLSVDIPRGRFYLPTEDLHRHGVSTAQLRALEATPEAINLIATHAHLAGDMMRKGMPLCKTIPGRAGWELRLVVQGGLRILDRIEALGFNTLARRPTIGTLDGPVMLWRALVM